jgi:hypothetical protein
MRTVSMPFKPGDRVVDLTLEKMHKTYVGTVIKVFRNTVNVNWDVDQSDWNDTMYVDELRFASAIDEVM